MSNPSISINVFKRRTKNALAKLPHTANVYPNQHPSMGDIMLDHIQHMRDTNDQGYLTFTTYKRNHQKDDIEACSAIMLEYPYSRRDQLIDRLSQLPHIHYLIDTIADFDAKAEARILAAFPLETPITEPRQYTRAASLLWDEIGIGEHSKGDISSTFLFAPYIVRPSVTLYDVDRTFIDADQYIAEHSGRWIDARHAEEPKAKPVVVSDDGLFSWGGR